MTPAVRTPPDLRLARWMLVVLGLGFPAWGMILLTAVPGAIDPPVPRVAVTALALGTALGSLRNETMARALEAGLALNATVAAMVAVWLAWANDRAPLYGIHMVAALGVGTLFVRTRQHFAWFWIGVTGAMALAVAWKDVVPVHPVLLAASVGTLVLLHGTVAAREDLLHEQIVERTTLLREVFENATDALFLLDPVNHQILLANQRVTEIFLAPDVDALLDRDARQLPARPLAPDEVEALREAMAGTAEVRLELPFRRFQGAPFWGDAVWRPITIGSRLYLLLRITPIDERIRAKQALEAARDAAQAAADAKSNFLASMSHEIRTPLNGVLGLAQLLDRSPLDGDQKAWVGTILASGRTLLSLIDELLDFSRIEAGELVIVEDDFDLHRALQDLHLLFRTQAEHKGVLLHFRVDPDVPPRVLADGKRITQVLVNLLGNALKFTEEGEVALHVSVVERQERCVLRFDVRDTGIGIAEKDVARIFEPFSQGDPGIARRYGGTGLGLAISRTIAQRMGGRLGVVSRPGVGSTFTFELSVGVPEVAVTPTEPAPVEAPVERRRPVLVAEDNEVNRMVVVEMLRRLGCDVDVARDGQAALERLHQRAYDVVFMDVMMPGIDGLEATRRLRRMPLARRPWVVALTAGVMPGDRERCAAAGMDDFVPKPVQLDELRRALQRAQEAERRHAAS